MRGCVKESTHYKGFIHGCGLVYGGLFWEGREAEGKGWRNSSWFTEVLVLSYSFLPFLLFARGGGWCRALGCRIVSQRRKACLQNPKGVLMAQLPCKGQAREVSLESQGGVAEKEARVSLHLAGLRGRRGRAARVRWRGVPTHTESRISQAGRSSSLNCRKEEHRMSDRNDGFLRKEKSSSWQRKCILIPKLTVIDFAPVTVNCVGKAEINAIT